MTLDLLIAAPVNSNTIRAFFSQKPKVTGPLGSDDALNRLNWTISLVPTPPPRVTDPVIEKVENPRAQPTFDATEPDAWSVDLRTDRRLIQAATYLLVGSSTITSADGALTLSPDPDDRDTFPGIVVLRPRRQPNPKQVSRRVDIQYDTFEGVFPLDPKNDLDTHADLVALKKRIIRRLISSPGGFSHLDDYGVGLGNKETFDPTSLAEIRARVTRQLKEEEEVERVAVDTSFSAGVLYVVITARTRNDDPLSLTITTSGSDQVTVT